MANKNGSVRGLRPADTVPRRKPFPILRDGKTVTLDAYVYGPRCPLSIKAEISAVYDEQKDKLTDKALTGLPLVVAYSTYYRDVLRALVPGDKGLTWDEADALAGDFDYLQECLVFLEFLEPTGEETEADDSPEASGGEASTGATSSPSSALSTAPATGEL